MADNDLYAGNVNGVPTFSNVGDFSSANGLKQVQPGALDRAALGIRPQGQQAAADMVFGTPQAPAVSARMAFRGSGAQPPQVGPTAAGLRQAGANPYVPALDLSPRLSGFEEPQAGGITLDMFRPPRI